MGIPAAGIPRFPGPGSSSRGQPDPKARPKGVVDGHGVNIPQPGKFRKGAQKKRIDGMTGFPRGEGLPSSFDFLHAAEKSPVGVACPSVPKPTQVEWYKDTKARERNLVKELGTLTP